MLHPLLNEFLEIEVVVKEQINICIILAHKHSCSNHI
jgi:hypothetical protein